MDIGLWYNRSKARRTCWMSFRKCKPWYAWGLAQIYAALAAKDEAFRWLEAGFDVRFGYMPWIERVRPLAPLRDDPRFQDLVRRIGIPQ